MGQFEGHWATRELMKGICQNARRHCRKKGITDPRLPEEFLGDRDNDGKDVEEQPAGTLEICVYYD